MKGELKAKSLRASLITEEALRSESHERRIESVFVYNEYFPNRIWMNLMKGELKVKDYGIAICMLEKDLESHERRIESEDGFEVDVGRRYANLMKGELKVT